MKIFSLFITIVCLFFFCSDKKTKKVAEMFKLTYIKVFFPLKKANHKQYNKIFPRLCLLSAGRDINFVQIFNGGNQAT